MGFAELEVKQDGDLWVVRLKDGGEGEKARIHEYRYGSEQQARFFAAVFQLGPTRLPPPAVVRTAAGRKVARRRRREAAVDPATSL